MTKSGWRQAFAINLFFVCFHPQLLGQVIASPPLVGSLAVNAVLFVVPALGWRALFRGVDRRLGLELARMIAVSTCLVLVSLVIARLVGFPLTAHHAWTSIWCMTNVGLLWEYRARGTKRFRHAASRRESLMGGALFLASYVFFFWGATRLVPPQVDHDLEVQATGYGLLHRMEPLLQTDRGGVYYFAHPLLLHVYVAESFLLYGSISDLAAYDEASRRSRDARGGKRVVPPRGPTSLRDRAGTFVIAAVADSTYVLEPTQGGPSIRLPVAEVELARILQQYQARPHLLESRTPNLFLAAAAVALLGVWVGRISRRWWLGVLTAVAYATSPEVFVRSSYGGYFAVGAFGIMLMLLAAHEWHRRARTASWHTNLTLPAVFAALTDHKQLLVPLAAGVQTVMSRARRGWSLKGDLLLHPLLIGFALGTVAFWGYGLYIAPAEFIQDHVRMHVFDRIAHLLPAAHATYPTVVAFWMEFLRHSAFIVLPAGLCMVLWDVNDSRSRVDEALKASRQLWFLMILLGMVIFSAVDWRMTKHVVTLLVPLHLALAPDRHAPRWRVAVSVSVLLIELSLNVPDLRLLARSFSAFAISPAW